MSSEEKHDGRLMLGIESSCDETSVALVARDGRVAVNLVASQSDLHAKFGGVVPEVAARIHIQACLPLVEQAMGEAGADWDQVEAIAVTQGPGLIGCLLVGIETAKTLAWVRGKPLVAVNHLAGHLYAGMLTPARGTHLLAQDGALRPTLPLARTDAPEAEICRPPYPHVGLIVSGGHTSLVEVAAAGRTQAIAATRDDAAGEAYDKFARVAGLGYPGGPVVDRLATDGNPDAFPEITPPMMRRDKPDFSFSGLKTQAGRVAGGLLEAGGGTIPETTLRDLCAAFQRAVVESLLQKTLNAARDRSIRDIVITGGVACNRGLRQRAAELTAGEPGLRFWFPHPSLCTDNAAMIAGMAWHMEPVAADAALALNALPGMALGA